MRQQFEAARNIGIFENKWSGHGGVDLAGPQQLNEAKRGPLRRLQS